MNQRNSYATKTKDARKVFVIKISQIDRNI